MVADVTGAAARGLESSGIRTVAQRAASVSRPVGEAVEKITTPLIDQLRASYETHPILSSPFKFIDNLVYAIKGIYNYRKILKPVNEIHAALSAAGNISTLSKDSVDAIEELFPRLDNYDQDRIIQKLAYQRSWMEHTGRQNLASELGALLERLSSYDMSQFTRLNDVLGPKLSRPFKENQDAVIALRKIRWQLGILRDKGGYLTPVDTVKLRTLFTQLKDACKTPEQRSAIDVALDKLRFPKGLRGPTDTFNTSRAGVA